MLKRKTLIPAFVIIIGLLISFTITLRNNYLVPILMYHYIVPDAPKSDRLTISPRQLERQMRFLRNNHYNIVALEAIADLIRDKKKIPPKTVAITFDDGKKDNFTEAFPILKKYNIPATMFIIVDQVGRPQGDKMNWQEIKTMQDSGLITIGSHTLTHPLLTEVTDDGELRRQIFDSKKKLEAELGRKVNTFCYPSGRFNSRIRHLVIEAGYKLAVATNPGHRVADGDLFVLKRLRISSNTNNLLVFWLESSGYYNVIREFHKKLDNHQSAIKEY